MKGEGLDMKTPATKEVNHSLGLFKMAPSFLTVLAQKKSLDQVRVDLIPALAPQAPVMEDRLSNPAEDLEHLWAAKEREMWIGAKIRSFMGSEGVGGPGRMQDQEKVEAVKTVALGKRREKGRKTVQRRKVKNLIGVMRIQRRNR